MVTQITISRRSGTGIDDGTLCRRASPLSSLKGSPIQRVGFEQSTYERTIDFIGSGVQDIYQSLQDMGLGVPTDFVKHSVGAAISEPIEQIRQDCVGGGSALQCVSTASMQTGFAVLNFVDPFTYLGATIDSLDANDVISKDKAKSYRTQLELAKLLLDLKKLSTLTGQMAFDLRKMLKVNKRRKDGGFDRRTKEVKAFESNAAEAIEHADQVLIDEVKDREQQQAKTRAQ